MHAQIVEQAFWGGGGEGGLDVKEDDRCHISSPPHVLDSFVEEVEGVCGGSPCLPTKLMVGKQGVSFSLKD